MLWFIYLGDYWSIDFGSLVPRPSGSSFLILGWFACCFLVQSAPSKIADEVLKLTGMFAFMHYGELRR